MNKLFQLLHKVAEYGTMISLVGMILAVAIQVFARFLLPSAPSWTEELSRIFFIYSVGFGVALGIKNESFVRLELIKNYLKKRAIIRLDRIIHVVVIVFSVTMIYYSWLFVQIGINEQSPSLKISMSAVFISILIMMFSIAVFSFEQLINSFPEKNISK